MSVHVHSRELHAVAAKPASNRSETAQICCPAALAFAEKAMMQCAELSKHLNLH
jgi:hypothetical protein